MNASGNNGTDDSKMALFCAACKTGYKAIPHPLF